MLGPWLSFNEGAKLRYISTSTDPSQNDIPHPPQPPPKHPHIDNMMSYLTKSSSSKTTTSTEHFVAHDLFEIEEWIEDFCTMNGWASIWKWSWNGAEDISEISHRLCNRKVDVNGEVSAFIDEDANGEKVRFRIVVGKVLIATGSSCYEDSSSKQRRKTKKDRHSSIMSRFSADEYKSELHEA